MNNSVMMETRGDALPRSTTNLLLASISVPNRMPLPHGFQAYSGPSRRYKHTHSNGKQHIVANTPSIVVKLTTSIIETYQTCNSSFAYSHASNPKRYLTNPSIATSNNGLDNANCDLILFVNSALVNSKSNHRYVVKDLLGQGTFGQVAKCWVEEKKCFVAVKVIKNEDAYYHQALREVSILKMLNHKFDPHDKHHIVRILDHFVFHGHLCIVFELLGLNLYELLKANHLRGISLNLLRLFVKQILAALLILRDAAVIHCDLKPENILLTASLQSAELKVIDFGSACMENLTMYSYIQSRYYRSPEVLLGHPYTTAIDMWSFGCVAAELFLGYPIFPGECQFDVLQRMLEILGCQPPDHILRNSKHTGKYFKHVCGKDRGALSAYRLLSLPEFESRQRKPVKIGKHYFNGLLEDIVAIYPLRKTMSLAEFNIEKLQRIIFVDFLRGLLQFDPLKRWTPYQAACHPFVTEESFSGPFQPPPDSVRQAMPQGFTVEHNPGLGHWFGAGLSPQVSSLSIGGQPSSPQFPYVSYGSSFGSMDSYGSFGDGGPGSSLGSYQSGRSLYGGFLMPSALGNASFGTSPEMRGRMGPSRFNTGGGGQSCLGAGGSSPSGLFPPGGGSGGGGPIRGSPSQFSSPSSLCLASPGSRFQGSSPASSLGQQSKNLNRSWGSSPSALSSSPRCGSLLMNPPGFGILREPPPNTDSPHMRRVNGLEGSAAFARQQGSALFPDGSLGALMSKRASDGSSEDLFDRADWDAFSEDQGVREEGPGVTRFEPAEWSRLISIRQNGNMQDSGPKPFQGISSIRPVSKQGQPPQYRDSLPNVNYHGQSSSTLGHSPPRTYSATLNNTEFIGIKGLLATPDTNKPINHPSNASLNMVNGNSSKLPHGTSSGNSYRGQNMKQYDPRQRGGGENGALPPVSSGFGKRGKKEGS